MHYLLSLLFAVLVSGCAIEPKAPMPKILLQDAGISTAVQHAFIKDNRPRRALETENISSKKYYGYRLGDAVFIPEPGQYLESVVSNTIGPYIEPGSIELSRFDILELHYTSNYPAGQYGLIGALITPRVPGAAHTVLSDIYRCEISARYNNQLLSIRKDIKYAEKDAGPKLRLLLDECTKEVVTKIRVSLESDGKL